MLSTNVIHLVQNTAGSFRKLVFCRPFRASIHARGWILISLAAKNTTSIACPISERYCRLAPFQYYIPCTWHPNLKRGREKERERARDQVWNVLCTAPLLYYVNGIVIYTGWHVTQSSETCRPRDGRNVVVNGTCDVTQNI